MIKVDSDIADNESLLREYNVRSIPTLVALSADRRVLGKQVGFKSEVVLRDWLGALIEAENADGDSI